MNPRELHVELTHACPLNCAPCDHRVAGGAQLSLPALKALFLSPQLKDLTLLSFSGGEPTLHTNFEAAVLAGANTFPKARLVILTSLYATARLEKFLSRLTPQVTARLHIGSSLDGPARLHNRIRGRTDAFARLKAAHARIRKNFPAVQTGFTFTASALNAAYFYKTWQTAAYTLSAPLGLQFLVPNKNTAGLKPTLPQRILLGKDIRRVLVEINRAQKARDIYPLSECLRLKHALDLLTGITKQAGQCGAAQSFAMLSPEGNFYLCPFHKNVILGSVAVPLEGVWTQKNASKAFRESGRRYCGSCFLRCTL